MYDIDSIVARNARLQAEHNASTAPGAEGNFTRELRECIYLYENTPGTLSAVEQLALFMARRLLALRAGAVWDETPCFRANDGR